MPRGRAKEEERALETVDEARALAADIKERAARLRTTPGLLDGALDEIRGSIERILREFEKMSRRRMGAFERDLEGIARRAKELETAGRLTPKHMRLIGEALQHTRRVHFWNAKRVLAKMDTILEPTRALNGDLNAYRAFQRKAVQRVREIEESLAKLRAVPKPAAAPEEVAAMRSLVEACNRAADEAWNGLAHRPASSAIGDLIAHPDVEGLGFFAVQEFASLRELYDLFEAEAVLKESVGARPLAELVTTSEFSAAKWDRVYPQAIHVRRKLQELFHHLRPIVGGKYGTAFALEATVPLLERRLASWRRFPGTEANPVWPQLAELRASARIPAVQESAKVYERFGDLATRAWDGSLADEMKERGTELAAARKVLDRLPSPEGLTS